MISVFQVKISSTINSGGNVRWAIQISLLVLWNLNIYRPLFYQDSDLLEWKFFFFKIIFKPELKWDHHLHRASILTCDKDRNEYVKYSQITKVSGLNFWTICKIFYVIFFPGYFCIWIAPVGLQKRTGSLSPVKNVRNLEMSNML